MRPHRADRRRPLPRTGLLLTPVAALVAALVSGAAVPAAPPVVPRPAAGTTAAAPEGDAASSAADLDASRARLAELQARAAAMTDALAQAQARLAADAAAASLALEAYATAVHEAQTARAAEADERDRLLRARLDLATQRENLGRFARSMYADGTGVLTQSPGLLTVLTARSSDEVPGTLEALRRAGRSKGRTVEALARAEDEQADAVVAAADATARADVATTAAARARRAADDAVAAQRATVAAQAELLAAARVDAAAAQDAVATAQAAASAAAARAAFEPTGTDGSGPTSTGASGATDPSCPGGDLTGSANGRLPVSALCPLWGTRGHVLRADAAAAWNALSRRYAQVFGSPVCVTDSYRTFDAQVDLARRKPGLAAVPGTSNHGWGTAVDLCGGVEDFGTPEHEWLVANGPLFGWFHPSWARQGGSREEPWHFEYGG